MSRVTPEKRRDDRGASLIEVLVSVMILSLAVTGLSGAGILAGTQLRVSRSDMRVYKAAQSQMELLTSMDYDSLTNGSAEVDGYPVVWTVEGSGPKKLTMVIEREGIHREAVADTFVTYLASWGS